MGSARLGKTAHLYKRGRIWWCWYYRGNEPIRKSTHCTDQRAAHAVLRTLERDAASDRPRTAPHTVSEALEHLVDHGLGNVSEHSKVYYASKTLVLARYLGHVDVNDLTLDRVQEFVSARAAEKSGHTGRVISTHTVQKELVTLRKALQLARARGLLLVEPLTLLPRWRARYAPRERHLTLHEYEMLREHLTEPKAPLRANRQLWLRVACYTGLRDKELREMTWDWVDFDRQFLNVGGTKTDKARRSIPLRLDLCTDLANHRGVGLVFQPWGNRLRDLKAACKRAGVAPVSPNDFRRTFASWLKEDGVDSAVVARLLGHASSAMVERVYGHLSDDALRAAVQHLPAANRLPILSQPEASVA